MPISIDNNGQGHNKATNLLSIEVDMIYLW